jgi:hypothetical protein
MVRKTNDDPLSPQTLIAYEGFLDARYLPLLEDSKVQVLKMRFLADVPIFEMNPHR